MTRTIQQEPIWQYLSVSQQDLIKEGSFLLEIIQRNKEYRFKDYSFLVFPFAKAYEGFLKQLFLDMRFITHLQYISDHFRLGKYLSPHLVGKLKEKSIYQHIEEKANKELADELWDTWKEGRNRVFHYFPHNLRRLALEQAEEMIDRILFAMEKSYTVFKKDNVT
ncbi:hypothetical protein KC726_02400 [Candidatus Woesebacteria bacterium]|nr:hypothetical protein [Candidatus Woesebacteria bacterium]